MIKYIEAPDLHMSPKWPDVNETIGDAIYNAAKEHGFDFIALPGDLMNEHLIATTKGGQPQIINIVKRWLTVCPVCAIEGTPSHDGPGAYAALEEAGLVLLKPGRVYGYWDVVKRICSTDEQLAQPDCLIFGIPELDTMNIHARLNIDAEQANAEALKALQQYIESFIAPRRAQYHDIPAIGLLHGVVSDSAQEFSNDVIIRASDIVIKTEVLERAGIDRWSLGHIHKPWESSKINAGYAGFAGIDNNPWGKKGFRPAMNLVTIGGRSNQFPNATGTDVIIKERPHIDIERIPYGTPRREKIVASLLQELPDRPENLALWVETDDKNLTREDLIAQGLHPWSRVTSAPVRTVTRRITRKEAEQARTLADLFKLYDPAVRETVIKKLDTIDAALPAITTEPIDARLDRVIIKGSIFWGGATMDFNLRDHGDMMLLQGDNGDGKSGLSGFLSLYPCVIGKDTKSGRPSAIKDFFNDRESSIEKFGTVNGHQHRHLITLKGAHTETCTFKGFIYIEDVPTSEKPMSFDEMMIECERLYGPFADYFLTSFYAQPLQGKTSSGLMNATMTDIRDTVQNIAGIDHEPQKRYALDRKAECEKQIEQKRNWIEGAEANMGDAETVQKELSDAQAAVEDIGNQLKQCGGDGVKAKAVLDSLTTRKQQNDRELQRKQTDEKTIKNLESKLQAANDDVSRMYKAAEELPALLHQEDALRKCDQAIIENQKIKNAYDSLVVAYNRRLSEAQAAVRQANEETQSDYLARKRAYDKELAETASIIDAAITQKEALNKPCVNCGYLDPGAAQKIKQLDDQITGAKQRQNALTAPVAPTPQPIPTALDESAPLHPVYINVPEAEGNLSDVQERIQEVERASTIIEERKRQIEEYNKELAAIQATTYTIDQTIDEQHAQATEELESLRKQYQTLSNDKARAEETAGALKRTLESIKENAEKIDQARRDVQSIEDDLADWSYIAANLQPSKLPAMELDIVLDEIDEAATANIAPYRDGVFSFHTITQQEGKKGSVDKFDILIRNNESGVERSFLEFSPGMKAFPNDAYVKALIKKRNERLHRHYSPIISDEADGQIKGDHVYTFFEMQRAFFADAGSQVIVISQHEKEAAAYIQEHVPVRGLLNK